MPIDAKSITWDAPDPKAITWDDEPAKAKPSSVGGVVADALRSRAKELANVGAGLVRGAGSIGATLMYPIDKLTDEIQGDRRQTLSTLVTGEKPLSRNEERRRDMTLALADLGADTDSFAFGAGKLGGEVAGTAGAGPVLGGGAKALGMARLGNALTTGGMSLGAPAATNALARVGDMGLRMAGGAATGGVSAGMVDPGNATAGSVIGGLLPPGVKVAGRAGAAVGDAVTAGANRLMQSAIKPTLAQLKSGDAAIAVKAMLERGISPNQAGVEKLRALITGLNDDISNAIGASTATVDKNTVLNALAGTRQKFGNQVSPTADLGAIQGVADDFARHPNLPGNDIPVQVAQRMKQGTYKVLDGKYGTLGSAETEAQKALARGLKEEISTAVPGVGALNAEESRLLTTLSVVERRALMEMNKNPGGLALLANNPASFIAFMADKSAAFKAIAARMMNASAPAANRTGQGLIGAANNPLLRTTGLQEEASP
jgi:hypothetical protein